MNLESYFMDDIAITIPDGFRDRTVQLLEWAMPNAEVVSLSITRDVLPRREADVAPSAEVLERFVAAETRGLATQFAGFRSERDERSLTTAGFPVHRRAFRWKKGADVLYHHHAYALLGERAVTLIGSAKAHLRPKVDFLLERALENLRRRKRD
jgi:hypothetical protein